MENIIFTSINLLELKESFRDIIQEELSRVRASEQPSDKNWSAKETAEYCKVSLVTIHSWTKKGILKKFKIGNRIFYKKVQVLEAIQEMETK